MTVFISLVPSGRPHDQLPENDPDRGIVVFTARPTHRPWAVGQDFLAALGVRHDLNGNGRRHGEDLDLVEAWSRANHIHTVVIRQSTNLVGRGSVLEALVALADRIDATLVLTSEDVSGPELLEWGSDCGAQLLAPDDLAPLVNKRTKSAMRGSTRPIAAELSPQGSPIESPYPQYLPRADFYHFRTACRDSLRASQFCLVDRLYCDTFTQVLEIPPTTPDEAAATVASLVAREISRGEAMTVVRATQAAVFTTGYLLKVNLDAFFSGLDDRRNRRMSTEELASLRAYRLTWKPAVAVLYDADVPKHEITRIRTDQVTIDGALVGVPHRSLAPHARLFLRAQRIFRLGAGGDEAAPLIGVDGTYVAHALRRIGVELNLPPADFRISSRRPRSEQWRYQLGVSLIPLTGPIARPKRPLRGNRSARGTKPSTEGTVVE